MWVLAISSDNDIIRCAQNDMCMLSPYPKDSPLCGPKDSGLLRIAGRRVSGMQIVTLTSETKHYQ
jgi:hypothetical protein